MRKAYLVRVRSEKLRAECREVRKARKMKEANHHD